MPGLAWAAGITPATAGVVPAAQAKPGTPLPHRNQTNGFQRPPPLVGVQGAKPPGGVWGEAPALLASRDGRALGAYLTTQTLYIRGL